ncbi:MAG: DUF1116 domain-containing protein [Anaerolineales bacterium]
MNLDRANADAVERMMEARPVLVGLDKSLHVIPGMHEDMLLHAGPPISWERASGPLRGAITGALILEGRVEAMEGAADLVQSGEIELEPCHHHQAVGPMAGVISPSMSVYILDNKTHGNVAYSNLNEGYGKVLRYGAYSEEVIAKLRWMEEVMAPVLKEAIRISGGLDIRALLADSLHMGDEGHNRNVAGSAMFTQSLAPFIAVSAPDPNATSEILQFLAENALSVLNAVMAACKAMADAAHGMENSSLVTVMARNGTDFGIRVSGLGDRWFTAPVATPQGKYFPEFKAKDASGDIGDSTITETAGIGGFAMASAPAIVDFISGSPADAVDATLEMYKICLAEHKYFTMPPLDFRGTPTGIDIHKVVDLEITPRVNTGIAHKEPGVGQIGAGLVRPPMAMFEQAVQTYQEKYA